MAQIRRLNVSAKSKDRMRVNIDAMLYVESGVLTKDELAGMRTVLADEIMMVLARLRYLSVNLSEVKVK